MEVTQITSIALKFKVEGDVLDVKLVKSGHIHDSYKVVTTVSKYFLQRINQQVFQNVKILMENISLVTNHLKKFDSNYKTLQIIPTLDGDLCYNNENSYWRTYKFIDGLTSYEVAPSEEYIFEAARAFGDFTNRTSYLADQLHHTIERFHSLNFRLKQLSQAINNTNNISYACKDLIQRVENLQSELLILENTWEQGKIIKRVTHNDTKLNNVLFDKKGQAICIVDLDTVMPGIIHFDIGDGIRTTCTTSSEDEDDPDTILPIKSRYDAFIEGYLEGLGYISTSEYQYIRYAAPYMSLIMGVRFLTDYLQGNQYFKIEYPDQNLKRAGTQIILAEKLNHL